MQKSVAASFLVVATLGQAHNGCDLKIDAINKQALSLKEHCASIKEFVDCMMTNCCGGGSCPCAPTPITSDIAIVRESGSYCLSNNVTSVTVEVDDVVIDLNSYTAGTVSLGDNSSVKNGTISLLQVGTNDVVSNAKIFLVSGDGAGSSVVLSDVSGLTGLQSVERVVMARCTGDGTSFFQIFAGVKDLTLYDSHFPALKVRSDAIDFERLALYRSMIKGNLELQNDSGDPDFTYSLKEISIYQSIVGGEVQLWGLIPFMEHFLIEESQIGQVNMYVISSDEFLPPQKINALFARSVFEEGITVQKFDGLVIGRSQLGGLLDLKTNNNVHLDNVSVTSEGDHAVTIAAGKNILCTDCCVTASWENQLGYMTSSFPENLNLIRCYAKGCYNGFDLNSAASCLVKDCVCDGAQSVSFSGNSTTTRAVGNIALSVGGVPATNFNPTTAPFDIDADTTFVAQSISAAENTLERSAWRNLSFELP